MIQLLIVLCYTGFVLRVMLLLIIVYTTALLEILTIWQFSRGLNTVFSYGEVWIPSAVLHPQLLGVA